LKVQDAERLRSDGLIEVRRRWEWLGTDPLEQVTLSVKMRVTLTRSRPFLPGVSYYNNPAGQSVAKDPIPVIGEAPGGKGFYEEHRFPMPVAAIEGERDGTTVIAGLHSLPCPIRYGQVKDQWWSLGLERLADDQVELALLSGAVATNGRTGVIKGAQHHVVDYPDAWCTLLPKAVVEKIFYVQPPSPTQRGRGFQQIVHASLRLFDKPSTEGFAPYREILERKFIDTQNRWREGDGYAGIDAFPGEDRPWIDLGWAGQSEAAAFAWLVLGDRFQIKDAKSMAQKSVDFICTAPFRDEGFAVRYVYGDPGNWEEATNPLSQAQTMYNLLNALEAARWESDLELAGWERFLMRACDLHTRRILQQDWHPVSTSEGFLIAPLARASRLLGTDAHLQAARKAADHYRARHQSMDEPYWGGTLDARCEDKEAAWACMQGFLAMYEATRESVYLEACRHAADVVLSYMMVWDVPLPPGRLSDHAFRTRGWTSVSVQNMHLDIYGVLCAPAFWRLGDHTDQETYKTIARLLTVPCGQLTDPWGKAGEQIQQTTYTQYFHDCADVKDLRGDYAEDWTVYWVTAHFLTAAAEFALMGVDCTEW
jgi:hypothetical protein